MPLNPVFFSHRYVNALIGFRLIFDVSSMLIRWDRVVRVYLDFEDKGVPPGSEFLKLGQNYKCFNPQTIPQTLRLCCNFTGEDFDWKMRS